MKPRSHENTKPPIPQSHSRSSEEGAASPQTETQKPSGGDSPRDGELSKYAALQSELAGQVRALTLLHEQRESFGAKSDALKAERAELEQNVLDGSHEAIADIVQNGDALVLNEVKLSALAVRINGLETELHTKFPLALATFCRLRSYVVDCVLESARQAVRGLIDPGMTVEDVHIDAVAICMPPYVQVSRLTLPGVTHTISRDLEFSQPHWSNLVRPYTPQEKAALRSETVSALISATNELCGAARRLLELAAEFPDRIPAFKCEPEVIEPAVVDPKFLEWQMPLGGSDAEFIAQHCKEAGKDPNNLSEADQRILAAVLEERRKMPISHGIVTAEMIGSTFQE